VAEKGENKTCRGFTNLAPPVERTVVKRRKAIVPIVEWVNSTMECCRCLRRTPQDVHRTSILVIAQKTRFVGVFEYLQLTLNVEAQGLVQVHIYSDVMEEKISYSAPRI
jgi:hypothetical protein